MSNAWPRMFFGAPTGAVSVNRTAPAVEPVRKEAPRPAAATPPAKTSRPAPGPAGPSAPAPAPAAKAPGVEVPPPVWPAIFFGDAALPDKPAPTAAKAATPPAKPEPLPKRRGPASPTSRVPLEQISLAQPPASAEKPTPAAGGFPTMKAAAPTPASSPQPAAASAATPAASPVSRITLPKGEPTTPRPLIERLPDPEPRKPVADFEPLVVKPPLPEHLAAAGAPPATAKSVPPPAAKPPVEPPLTPPPLPADPFVAGGPVVGADPLVGADPFVAGEPIVGADPVIGSAVPADIDDPFVAEPEPEITPKAKPQSPAEAVIPGLTPEEAAEEEEGPAIVPGLRIDTFDPTVEPEEDETVGSLPPPGESANKLAVPGATAKAREFTLTNGERISGEVLTENEEWVYLKTPTLGVVTIARRHLAGRLMEVILLNGDRVVGEVVAENKDTIYLNNASLGTLTIPRDQTARNVVEAVLANGNRIVGELVIESEEIVLIKSAALGTVSIDRRGLRQLSQRVEQLTTRELPSR